MSFLTSVAKRESSPIQPAEITSTSNPRRSATSVFSLLAVKSDAPPWNLTNKSTSLSGRSSLRAHEPKTQSFSALCFLAIAYISSRFARILSSIHITSSLESVSTPNPQNIVRIPKSSPRRKADFRKSAILSRYATDSTRKRGVARKERTADGCGINHFKRLDLSAECAFGRLAYAT